MVDEMEIVRFHSVYKRQWCILSSQFIINREKTFIIFELDKRCERMYNLFVSTVKMCTYGGAKKALYGWVRMPYIAPHRPPIAFEICQGSKRESWKNIFGTETEMSSSELLGIDRLKSSELDMLKICWQDSSIEIAQRWSAKIDCKITVQIKMNTDLQFWPILRALIETVIQFIG